PAPPSIRTHGCTTMKRQWTRDELADHWTLGPTELELLANKSGATRLGFAILLKAFTIEGRFPRQKHDVPLVVIVHVANQVNVPADLYPARQARAAHRLQVRGTLKILCGHVAKPPAFLKDAA